jgi:hypothetical protein
MSDSETASQPVQGMSFTPGIFSTSLLHPMLNIPPPAAFVAPQKEIVTYSKEVQTTAWIPEENSEEEEEEVVKRRVDEEVRKKLERLRLDEEEAREAEIHRLEAEKEIPGILPKTLS